MHAETVTEQRIPSEHATIHARLEQWGRWSRARGHQGHVASLEGHYRAPRGAEFEWESATPPAPPMPPPPDPECLAIELIWRFVPVQHAQALKLIYVRRYSEDDCRRRVHVHVSAWNGFIWRARQAVINLLRSN